MKPVSELLRGRTGTLWHIGPHESVFTALQVLAKYEVGALLVMEGAQLVGVVSERDYTRKVALQGRSSKETTVGEIMTRQVITIGPKTGTGDRVLGMISIRDIMDDIIAQHETTIAQLESYIHS